MSTIIDSLVVELGLDPKGFTKGQKDAAAAFLKTKEEALRTAKDIEAASQRAADALSRIATQALTVFAIFTAGRGIKDFIEDTTNANAALARLSQNVGSAPSSLSAWQKGVERAGGTAAGAAASFQALSDAIQGIKSGDTHIVPILSRLQGLGGTKIDWLNGTPEQIFAAISQDLQAIQRKYGPAYAHSLGSQLPIDQGSLYFLQHRNVGQELARSRGLGVLTDEQVDRLQKLQDSWIAFTQKLEYIGEALVADLAPVLSKILDWLTELAKDHPKLLEIVAASAAAVTALAALAVAIRILAAAAALLGVTRGGAAATGAGAAAVAGGGIFGRLFGLFRGGAIPLALGTLALMKEDNANPDRPLWHSLRRFFGIEDTPAAGAGPGATGISPNTPLSSLNTAQRAQLLDAMHRVESGGRPGSLSERNNNPGNIRFGEWAARRGAVPGAAGFARFATYEAGRAAQEELIFGRTYGGRTIQGMLNSYAPASDRNDPAAYARTVARSITPSSGGTPAAGGTAHHGTVHFLSPEAAEAIRRAAQPAPAAPPALGAPGAATIRNSTSSLTNNTTSSAQIGAIHVYSQATDANGIARDIGGALRSRDLATQANTGLA